MMRAFCGRTAVTWLCAALLALAAVRAEAQPINGAGSTFAFPVIASWSEGFEIARADGTDFVSQDGGVSYEPIGSVGGIVRLNQPDVDFAATDAPLPPADLEARGLIQFPIVVGGLAVVVNLPGVESGGLMLPRAVLADIYLGRITDWSDPALAAANPGLALPDLPIRAVGRLDGSGSTRSFTRYLSLASEDWASAHGSNTRIDWPAAISVEGSGKVIEAVAATEGAIGYVEFGQAERAGLAAARVENLAGAFVAPDAAAFAATAAKADWRAAPDFHLLLTDVDTPDAYPITTATFALLRREDASGRIRRVLRFFDYALESGGDRARELSYVALPPSVVALVQDHWRRTLPGAEAF